MFVRRKITQKEFDIVLASHTRAYVDGYIDISINWKNVDLSEIKCDNKYIGHFYLTDSVLYRASFQNSNFDCSFFKGIDLAGVNFSEANLDAVIFADCSSNEGVLFISAQMNNTIMNRCRLYGANFNFANLSNAFFIESCLPYSSFIGADLTGVNFTRADLSKSFITEEEVLMAKLAGAKFDDAIMPWDEE